MELTAFIQKDLRACFWYGSILSVFQSVTVVKFSSQKKIWEEGTKYVVYQYMKPRKKKNIPTMLEFAITSKRDFLLLLLYKSYLIFSCTTQ